jgi:thiamine biosynthesis lipoprotein
MRGLGTTAIVVVTQADALQAARRILARELRAFDLACSRFRHDSELAAVNRGRGRAVAASRLLREAVHHAIRAAAQTDGLVDPTVGRAMGAVGYDQTFLRVALRDGRLVRPAFECAGRWQEVEVDDERGTVRVPIGVELDLGATAKAFAADRTASAVARETAAGVLVSIGGDVAVAAAPPPGGWPVGIAHVHSAPGDDVPACVALSHGGLATSSTRVRRWSTAAGCMHHIVDPRTGRPANGPWATASVAAATCVDANAASTAAIVLGAAAPVWLERRRLPARLAADDGGVVLVGGWPEDRAIAE